MSRDDYQGASLKSSMQSKKQVIGGSKNQGKLYKNGSKKKLIRGSSVTSLYSQEKERKSVSIRRSRSKPSTTRSGRDQSNASEELTQSLERMYTFNLSRVQKANSTANSVSESATKDDKNNSTNVRKININTN